MMRITVTLLAMLCLSDVASGAQKPGSQASNLGSYLDALDAEGRKVASKFNLRGRKSSAIQGQNEPFDWGQWANNEVMKKSMDVQFKAMDWAEDQSKKMEQEYDAQMAADNKKMDQWGQDWSKVLQGNQWQAPKWLSGKDPVPVVAPEPEAEADPDDKPDNTVLNKEGHNVWEAKDGLEKHHAAAKAVQGEKVLVTPKKAAMLKAKGMDVPEDGVTIPAPKVEEVEEKKVEEAEVKEKKQEPIQTDYLKEVGSALETEQDAEVVHMRPYVAPADAALGKEVSSAAGPAELSAEKSLAQIRLRKAEEDAVKEKQLAEDNEAVKEMFNAGDEDGGEGL